jgi:hypothetical protein
LEALGISSTDITRVPLGPGRYQTEDITLEAENAGFRRGTVIGAPIGAAVGLGMAIAVPEARAAVHTTGGMGAQTGRARAALHRAGAIGFLDPSVYDPEALVSVARRR